MAAARNGAGLSLEIPPYNAMNAATTGQERRTLQTSPNPPRSEGRELNSVDLQSWLGRQRRQSDEMTLGAVQRLAATLDQDPMVYKAGSDVPESWYTILFGPLALQSGMGVDGHPKTGDDFMPPMHGTRRMFAGRRVTFHKPIRVGDSVEQVSTIRKVEPKTGRSGSFTLVTLVHEMSTPSGLVITEEQDVVYRQMVADPATSAAGGAEKKAEKPAVVDGKTDWSRPWSPDTVLLFRYSALTFNAHRIHYDLAYAREKEGYHALVVNGGLTALMLVETARPHLKGRIVSYDARAMQPLFIGDAITLNGRITGDVAECWATGPSGTTHYRVNARIA